MQSSMTDREREMVLDSFGSLVAYRGDRRQCEEMLRQTLARASEHRRREIGRQRASRTLSRELVMA